MTERSESSIARPPFDPEACVTEIAAAVRTRLDSLPAACRAEMAAVVLGGGYGRGEGGVFTAADGAQRLYNDLDFFLFTRSAPGRGGRAQWRARLAPVERELSKQYQVEVEFGPATGLDELERLAPTLMYQELIRGMRPVWGDPAAVIHTLPELPWRSLPRSEGARLLLNRGAGLLLAARRMGAGETAGDPAARDFAVRNIHKAATAVGDAWLLARNRYEFGLRNRLALLNGAPDFPAAARKDYEAALQFKFAPYPDAAPDLAERWARVTGEYLSEVADYASHCPPELPEHCWERVKNWVRHGLVRLPEAKLRDWNRHPRYGLQQLLTKLLVDKLAKRLYIKDERNFADVGEQAFLRGWRRFN